LPAVLKDQLIRDLDANEIVRDGNGLARVEGADVVLGTSNSSDATADVTQGLRPSRLQSAGRFGS